MDDEIRPEEQVVALPPLIFAGGAALAVALNAIAPSPLAPRALAWPLAAGSLAGGVGLVLWAGKTMSDAGTEISPHEPTTALVVEGPFRRSRNPVYVGFSLIYAAIALAANTRWALVVFPGVLTVMGRGVIDREEKLLLRKFGAQYEAYRAQVRRWL